MKTEAGLSGLLSLDKKPGITSFEALNKVKQVFHTPKVGHAGTLDKFASGLLLVLVGKGVKLCSWVTGSDKEYEGTIRFGMETDTLDPEGLVIAEAPPPDREAVERALPLFRGNILQTPPAYSALHVNGRRAHELVREGKNPEMKQRPVTIHELELLSWEAPLARIHVRCSSGTYVRSLARDLALASGSRGHLTALRRKRIAGFSVEDAAEAEDDPRDYLKPLDAGIFEALALPYFLVDNRSAEAMFHGKPLGPLLEDAEFRSAGGHSLSAGVFRESGALAAMVEEKDGRWVYGHVFTDS